MRTRVKICGITNPSDAVMACEAGADAIGLIFHPPAARGVSIIKAEEITRALPPFAVPVGLFLDAPVENILAVAGRLKLRCLQLHGHESPEDIRKLEGYDVIKAIHVKPGKLNSILEPWRKALADGLSNLKGLVFETGWVAAKGGSGVENDWQQIREIQESGELEGLPPMILAGGLTPSNVGGVVEMLRPYAVDVSSGVEETKGRKSLEKLNAFIRAVRCSDRKLRQAIF